MGPRRSNRRQAATSASELTCSRCSTVAHRPPPPPPPAASHCCSSLWCTAPRAGDAAITWLGPLLKRSGLPLSAAPITSSAFQSHRLPSSHIVCLTKERAAERRNGWMVQAECDSAFQRNIWYDKAQWLKSILALLRFENGELWTYIAAAGAGWGGELGALKCSTVVGM